MYNPMLVWFHLLVGPFCHLMQIILVTINLVLSISRNMSRNASSFLKMQVFSYNFSNFSSPQRIKPIFLRSYCHLYRSNYWATLMPSSVCLRFYIVRWGLFLSFSVVSRIPLFFLQNLLLCYVLSFSSVPPSHFLFSPCISCG